MAGQGWIWIMVIVDCESWASGFISLNRGWWRHHLWWVVRRVRDDADWHVAEGHRHGLCPSRQEDPLHPPAGNSRISWHYFFFFFFQIHPSYAFFSNQLISSWSLHVSLYALTCMWFQSFLLCKFLLRNLYLWEFFLSQKAF